MKGGAAKERLQKAVDYWYVRALDMFGRSGSTRAERYCYWRLKQRSNEQAREEYIREVNPILLSMGWPFLTRSRDGVICEKEESMPQAATHTEALDEHLSKLCERFTDR